MQSESYIISLPKKIYSCLRVCIQSMTRVHLHILKNSLFWNIFRLKKSYKNSLDSSHIALTQIPLMLTCYAAVVHTGKLILMQTNNETMDLIRILPVVPLVPFFWTSATLHLAVLNFLQSWQLFNLCLLWPTCFWRVSVNRFLFEAFS